MKQAFRVVAHRGDNRHAPENTLAAFARALNAGADELETDVRVTADGIAVLCHDESLRRTTGVDWPLRAMTWAEVEQLDAATGFRQKTGQEYPITRVTRLDEFLAAYALRLPLQIELKSADATAALLECLKRASIQIASDRLLVTSFEADYLRAAMKAEPSLRCGHLLNSDNPATPAAVKALGCRAIIPHAERLTPGLVAEASTLQLSVRSWGVNTLAAAQRVVEAGAEACTYDDPGELADWLKQSGRR